MSAGPNREQLRAKHAYEVVRRAREGNAWTRYESLVMGLPVVILRCGLVGAVAWLARDKEVGKAVMQDASAEVPGLAGNPSTLMERVCQLELAPYMVATREALKVAGWLKRAAQAMPKAEVADAQSTT